MNQKCNVCRLPIQPNCDWQQGRCPHRTPILNDYHFRYLTLFQSIKKFFTKNKNEA